MLKFVNKKGQKVMELKDNGDLNVLNEDLQKSFEKEDTLKEKTEEKKDK